MWSKITCRKTGEMQLVASLEGIDSNAFDIEAMGRAPKNYEVLDGGSGKLRDHRKDLQPMPRTRADLEALIRSLATPEKAVR